MTELMDGWITFIEGIQVCISQYFTVITWDWFEQVGC
jgi:hypothetical protein